MTPEQFNDILRENLQDFVTRDEFTKGKDEILTAVAEIKKLFDDHEIEHTANIAAHDRLEERLTLVEKKVGLAA